MDMTLALITLLSLVVATVMSLVSWRLIRDERARSVARVSALAATIQDAQVLHDLPLRALAAHAALAPADSRAPASRVPSPESQVPSPESLEHEMFASAQAASGRSRLALAATILLLVGTVGSMAVVLGVLGHSGQSVADGRAPVVGEQDGKTRAPILPAVPLELVALGHVRDADGLVVRGVLRNPSTGSELDALTAVVLLFNRDGGLVTSGRAAVEAATLEPGGETTFVVTVSGAGDVERYRVSFRSVDRVVPHVDQREVRSQKSEAKS